MFKNAIVGRRTPSGQGKKPAFTLIELLVVIAIIAILASILFPVFARAREKARAASCQSNLKQLGLGIAQYTQDYDEKFPGSGVVPPGAFNDVGTGWAGLIYPYVKSAGVYTCASDASANFKCLSTSGACIVDQNPQGVTKVSYAYNGAITADSASFFNGRPWGINRVVSLVNAPAVVVLLCESSSTYGLVNGGSDSYTNGVHTHASMGTNGYVSYENVSTGGGAPLATGFTTGRRLSAPTTDFPDAGRHTEGANYLLVDGHVKWLKGSNVSTGWRAVTSAQDAQDAGGNSPYAAGTANSAFAVTFSPT